MAYQAESLKEAEKEWAENASMDLGDDWDLGESK